MLGECETITANNSKANKGMIFEENVLNKISKCLKEPINSAIKITKELQQMQAAKEAAGKSKHACSQPTTMKRRKESPRPHRSAKQRNLHVLLDIYLWIRNKNPKDSCST